MKIFHNSNFEILHRNLSRVTYIFRLKPMMDPKKDHLNYNHSAARQTRTDDPLVNSQLSFGAQYRAVNLLYHAELERRTITANPRTK
jgi:hypothetical protein